jgi:predicted dehydrogenase
VSRIRIGIVGAGDNTRGRHIPGLRAINGIEIVSVCNRRPESSQRVADAFDIPAVYDSWQDLVAARDTDAIVIGTWPYLHCPVTLAALDAGKHVMCEARMAMDLDEARRMRDAAKHHPDCVTQIVPAPMSLHVDRTVQRLIAEEFLGDILQIDVRVINAGFPDSDAPMSWRADRELSGKNIMSLGIWYEILMRWAGEASRVSALGKVFVKQRRDSDTGELREVHVPEHLDVIADMESGAQAHFSVSAVGGRAPASEIVLRGSRGTLRFAEGVLYGGQQQDSEMEEISPEPGEIGEWRVEAEFVGAIRGEEKVYLTDFETGVRYMAFTEAVHRSLEEGRIVDIERD